MGGFLFLCGSACCVFFRSSQGRSARSRGGKGILPRRVTTGVDERLCAALGTRVDTDVIVTVVFSGPGRTRADREPGKARVCLTLGFFCLDCLLGLFSLDAIEMGRGGGEELSQRGGASQRSVGIEGLHTDHAAGVTHERSSTCQGRTAGSSGRGRHSGVQVAMSGLRNVLRVSLVVRLAGLDMCHVRGRGKHEFFQICCGTLARGCGGEQVGRSSMRQHTPC
mmetsp:Transcript_44840/g.78253  ORF Transcript_44840/g.78253 Transcript_44840/m.78253 type:complete len:223 (+) Transcript_44840:1187-1855(+)